MTGPPLGPLACFPPASMSNCSVAARHSPQEAREAARARTGRTQARPAATWAFAAVVGHRRHSGESSRASTALSALSALSSACLDRLRPCLEILHRRPFHHLPVQCVARAVARAVPGPLGGVERDLAVLVSADRRHGVERSVVVAVGGNLPSAQGGSPSAESWSLGSAGTARLTSHHQALGAPRSPADPALEPTRAGGPAPSTWCTRAPTCPATWAMTATCSTCAPPTRGRRGAPSRSSTTTTRGRPSPRASPESTWCGGTGATTPGLNFANDVYQRKRHRISSLGPTSRYSVHCRCRCRCRVAAPRAAAKSASRQRSATRLFRAEAVPTT